ncbi:MAG: DUF3786 domain-containing protein [Eubacteriales bacterium]|nr:DUF3786 domain-containing protein [Eubacteriales bacterium]
MEERKSNYDVFKQQALERFLTYDQRKCIDRLQLENDEQFIFIPFCGRVYRLGRREPVMESVPGNAEGIGGSTGEAAEAAAAGNRTVHVSEMAGDGWKEASCNEVLTICDLLCHTEAPVVLSGEYCSLESLNRVRGGSSTILGEGFHARTEALFDQNLERLKKAAEELQGVPAGKGDAAYQIPLFGEISMRFSFYASDEEFPPKLTIYFDRDICRYLFYETLYYAANLVLERLQDRIIELKAEEAEMIL